MIFSTELNLKLNSNPQNISKVEPFLQKVRRHCPLCEEQYYDIVLVLTEAVNNSILHGNEADPRKKVSVHARVNQERVIFTIKDEGKGFDPNKLPDPTTPDRIGQPSGRGVFIMKKLADYVDYSNKGRQLDLQFSVRSTRQG